MSDNLIKLTPEQKKQMKDLWPELFVPGGLDVDLLINQMKQFPHTVEKYELGFSGKTRAKKTITQKINKELFYSEGKSVHGESSQNLFIEGDNIDALRLLVNEYEDRIKMITIDPPYNTGSDTFIYADKFHREHEAEQIAPAKKKQKQVKNNSGQIHSNWLSMMYPRMILAKKLLSDSGVLFVSIDDNEAYALKLLLDEVFGEENFLGNIIWNSTKSVTNTALLSVSHTHNLVYFKNLEYHKKNRTAFRLPDTPLGFSNPDNDERGPWKADPFQVEGERPNQMYEIINPLTGKVYLPNPGCSWKNDLQKFQTLMTEGRIVFGSTGQSGPQRKRFLFEAMERGRVAKSLWTDIETTSNGTSYLEKLVGKKIFTNPKPLSLIQRFIQLGTNNDNDIVLDFFGGSGTTAEAVMVQNRADGKHRNFILVTLAEIIDERTQAGKNALSLGCNTIADVARLRLLKAIEKLELEKIGEEQSTKEDLGFRYLICS